MAAEPLPDPLRQLTDEELLARLPRAAALPDAPAAWVSRAMNAWQAPLAARLADAAGELRQRVQAWLAFDSWAAAPAAAGLRSAGPAPTRQLVFSAEGRDVDLRIAPAEGSQAFSVSGQVLGPDDPGRVTLVPETPDAAGASAAAARREAALDAFGEFRLDGVAPGRYRLNLLLPAHEVELPAFDVGGPIRFVAKDGQPG